MSNENNIPIASVAININENDLVLTQAINHSSSIIVAERADNYDLSGNNEILVAYQDIEVNNVDRTRIDIILNMRNKLIRMFWLVLLFNILLILLNPLSVIYSINLVYNLYTIKFLEPILLKTTIIYNLFIIFIILVSNMVISINLPNIAMVFKVDIVDYFQISIIYFLSLLFISTCVVGLYIYLIQKFYIISRLRRGLNNAQNILLNSLL